MNPKEKVPHQGSFWGLVERAAAKLVVDRIMSPIRIKLPKTETAADCDLPASY